LRAGFLKSCAVTLVIVRRIYLSHLPTPLYHNEALDSLVGTELWVKLDDSNAGAASGNKIRKLEFLLAQALDEQATHVITCGGEQSNHARATALAAARLGMKSLLLLRTHDPWMPPKLTGNLLLDRLAGAELRFISHAQYAGRESLMQAEKARIASEGLHAYVIPEGGSNGLGALGWLEAMREVRQQLDLGLGGGPRPFDAIVHACGSGGTAAGCVLGAAAFDVAPRIVAMAVCDTADYFNSLISSIIEDCRRLDPSLGRQCELQVFDDWKGPAYAVANDEQLRFMVDVARRSGLVLDPVYTGKALYGLSQLEPKPRRTLFLHTGGLPGLLAQASELSGILGQSEP
jgi:D-cysteine desulfhydrase